MSFTDVNMYYVIAITVLAGIGITMYFVGALITVASAFGEKRTLWGVVCISVLPLALVYCIKYWQETAYQRKYIFSGAALIILAFLILLLL